MSTINISYTSELISNYMQAETVAPDQKFQAVQTADGHSILFSIGTDGVFYLTEEILGEKTGWIRNDLSSALAANFPSAGSVSARTFGVGQNDATGAFTVLVALTVDGQDHLYVASSYTRDDENDITVDWTELPFDGTNGEAPARIANINVMQTASVALIVVDAQNPSDNMVDRYYIDSQKTVSSHYWNLLNLPVGMDATQPVQLCFGRKSGDYVNGIYTLGSVGGQQSIIYQELYDPFGDGAGATSRLYLPQGVTPNAIASTPSAGTPSTSVATYTDLYVTTTDGDLYFFAASNQHDSSTGVRLFSNDIMSEVNALYAYTVGSKVVVWGLNRAQQIFYTQCSTYQVSDGSKWSYPLPIGSGIEQISPYINRVNGGNTYFAHIGADTLKKVFQDPVSTTWQKQNILLPVDPNTTAQKFDSYTTTINVVDEYNAPVAGVEVLLGSRFRVPVYVNNHYFVLDTEPIPVLTDGTGSLTVVQRIENTIGAILTVQSPAGGPVLNINPMSNGVTKIVRIDSADDLSAATVTDDKGENPSPLVDPATSSDDLNSSVASLQSLSDAYSNYAPTGTSITTTASGTAQSSSFRVAPARTVQLNVSDSLEDLGDAIVVAAGDVYEFLTDAVDYVIEIIEDTANAVWNFVCTIGDKILTFVVDTIEKVIGAIEAIFDFLGTLIKDLIQFMKFLFSWGDIQRTKDVFKNVSVVYMQAALNSVDYLKDGMNDVFGSLEAKVAEWAGLDTGSGSGDSSSINNISASQDSSQMNTASGSFLQYHFVNNVGNAVMTTDGDPDGAGSAVVDLMETLALALAKEVKIVLGTADAFYETVLKDNQYRSMSLEELFKQTVGILAEGMLLSAENVTDAFLDVVAQVAAEALSILETPIWIPVLSDILEEFFDATIPFSWLDVIMLVGALPATLMYKILTGNAPFTEDDGFSTALIHAQTMSDVYAAMGESVPAAANTLSLMAVTTQPMPSAAKQILFDVGRLLTMGTAIVSGLLFWPINTPGIKNLGVLKLGNAFTMLATGVINGAVQLFAQPAAAQNKIANLLSVVLNGLLVLEKITFAIAMIVQKGIRKAGTAAVELVDKVLTLIIKGVSVITIGEHLYELIKNYKSYPTQANLALLQSLVQVCGIGIATLNLIVTFVPEGITKNVLLGIGIGAFAVEAVIQYIEYVYASSKGNVLN